MSINLSFKLSENFIDAYKNREVDWGYKDAAGNSVAEITFLRTYSRLKEDGTKERWWEVCRRVIEGTFSIQKDHCKSSRLPWNDRKAQATAQDAYDRLFTFKWTPPGRGLWMMGTPLVNDKKNSAALQNCSFVSTSDMSKFDPSEPFCFLMEASMLGVGVGFDTKGADKDFSIHQPKFTDKIFVVQDSREGWIESIKLTLNAYLIDNHELPLFDYSQIRPAGSIIKTFGGVASGSEPLERLHNSLNKVLGESVGKKLNSRLIADIGNLMGVCVVSGNVRRSAELLMGSIHDDEFLTLKDYTGAGAERAEWSWMSNNSVEVKVGDNLEKIIPGIAQNGEPGVIWMDVTRKYGRLADPINNKDWRAAGFNPCLVESSTLLTESGWITFGDAYKSGEKNNLIVDSRVTYEPSVDGKEHPENWKINYAPNVRGILQPASEVFLTQKAASVVKVTTKQGFEVTLTPDHLVATKTRGMVAAGNLITGEEILLTAGSLPTASLVGIEPKTSDEKAAALMGLITGDGYYNSGNLTEKVNLCLWGNDREHLNRITSWIDDLWEEYRTVILSQGDRPFTKYYVSKISDREETRISSSFLAALLEQKYGFNKKSKLVVPKFIMNNARSTIGRYYVAGLAFADGYVNKYNKVGSSSARITQSNKRLLQDVQLILLANGMNSTIYLRRNAGKRVLPDGNGSSKEYDCLATYELLVMSHKYEFAQYVGFLGSFKDALAKENLTKSRKRNHFTATVLMIEDAGVEDVYCLREPQRRILCADGITMRRCAEQSLESYEMCTLVETFLNRHDSIEDYKRTLKVAYLYAKTVTLLPTHWQKTNAIMQRNRRIGTSMSGIANFADNRGLPILREWMDKGYQEIQRLDVTYSEWLCVRESIKTTTVKPSGTVSILAGESPGVHWSPGGEYFNRAIRFRNIDAMIPKFRNAGYTVEPAESDPDGTVVVYFPIHSQAKRSEHDVTLFEKTALAATAQRWWSDNSVSVTLSFDPDLEAEHVGSVLGMYEGQLKTVSFLPMIKEGAYAQMPYTEITEKQYKDSGFKLWPVDLSSIYDGGEADDAEGEQFCTTDSCLLKSE